MKSLFQGYYRPTDAEFQALWDEASFVFDANVLLNLYRYTKETAEDVLQLIASLQERLWLPHQVALEFHENRIDVITSQVTAYDEVERELDKAAKSIETTLGKYRYHPFLQATEISKLTEQGAAPVRDRVKALKAAHPDYLADDPILAHITGIYQGRVGQPYDDARLQSIRTQGKQRYAEKIPPGYKDEKKGDAEAYGDLIIWYQMIDHAEATKKPVIFVTDDTKEDWWWEQGGKTLGPRPELVHEFAKRTGCRLYAYRPDRFFELARGREAPRVKSSSIEEVKQVQETEQTRRAMFTETDQTRLDELRRETALLSSLRGTTLDRLAKLAYGAQTEDVLAENAVLRRQVQLYDQALQTITPELVALEQKERTALEQKEKIAAALQHALKTLAQVPPIADRREPN